MNRRLFLAASAALPLARAPGARAETPETFPLPGWRRFEITTRVALRADPGPARLWLPLAQDAAGYQIVLDARWRGNGRNEPVRDERHDAATGAPMLRATWENDAGAGEAPRQIEVTQTVATRDRDGGLPWVPLGQAERRFWTEGTPDIPTDGTVRETALRIIGDRAEPRARLRALYDWVVDNTWRDPGTPGCGLGDIASMLENRRFGGKCADINGLMVALARAAGFPARDVYGIRVADSRLFPSLGKSGDISRAQHCRAEAFLEDVGWFPLDPADVRKVVLEQKLPLDGPEGMALRERLFGRWEMNWVGYNSATGVELPGAGRERSNFAFLMYPCAFTAGGRPDPLDPDRFRYAITARELSA